jgi:hypothetical protein
MGTGRDSQHVTLTTVRSWQASARRSWACEIWTHALIRRQRAAWSCSTPARVSSTDRTAIPRRAPPFAVVPGRARAGARPASHPVTGGKALEAGTDRRHVRVRGNRHDLRPGQHRGEVAPCRSRRRAFHRSDHRPHTDLRSGAFLVEAGDVPVERRALGPAPRAGRGRADRRLPAHSHDDLVGAGHPLPPS